MRIENKQAIADNGKRIRRVGSNSEGYSRCTLLKGETEASFEEADHFDVIDESFNYNEEVNNKIRERYSESQEFAILRQRDVKPQEFEEYNAYCEQCKTKVKSRIMKGE